MDLVRITELVNALRGDLINFAQGNVSTPEFKAGIKHQVEELHRALDLIAPPTIINSKNEMKVKGDVVLPIGSLLKADGHYYLIDSEEGDNYWVAAENGARFPIRKTDILDKFTVVVEHPLYGKVQMGIETGSDLDVVFDKKILTLEELNEEENGSTLNEEIKV